MTGAIIVTQRGYISHENIIRFHDGQEATGTYWEQVLEPQQAIDVILDAVDGEE